MILKGMKAKTIRSVLRKKITNWLNTIEDEIVRGEAERDVIVSGGAIASMLMGEQPNDYDFYFRTRKTALLIASYYVDQFNQGNKLRSLYDYEAIVKEEPRVNCKGIEEDRIIIYMRSAGVAAEDQSTYKYFESEEDHETESFIDSLAYQLKEQPADTIEEVVEVLKEKKRYRPVFLTDNAITLSDKVQLIVRFYGDIDAIHTNFDFAHAMCSYSYFDDELLLPAESLEALLSRTLVYKGSLYPIASIFRIRKFIERGFRISAGQLLKIIWQVNELDLSNNAVLMDQLIGVDVAYMRELIERIQNEKAFKIDSAYVASLIDEIFE